jgi:hypothetical protein
LDGLSSLSGKKRRRPIPKVSQQDNATQSPKFAQQDNAIQSPKFAQKHNAT